MSQDGPPAPGRLSRGCRRSLGERARRSLAARSRRSFPHRDFENPEAETCWLSCLFQSLWHSVVFHTAFEEHLAHHVPKEDERILAALQLTWKEYRAAEELLQSSAAGAGGAAPECLVPPDDLAEAFGDGYGDMAEALALMQDELSQSGNPAAVRVGAQIALVPISADEESLPTPAMAWAQACDWGVNGSLLIAVEVTLPQPTRECSRHFAELWVPGHRQAPASSADLGPSHRLVSLVCYMWECRHYVAFCSRQREPSRCVFFNDIPAVTQNAPREVDWSEVPELAARYFLTPRLALYECAASGDSACRDPAAFAQELLSRGAPA